MSYFKVSEVTFVLEAAKLATWIPKSWTDF